MGERGPGRPRSERAHRAVLEAARDLVLEIGFERLTIEGIASRACVGKHTIYRWWPSKAAVVGEAFREGYLELDGAEMPDTGDIRADLGEWWRCVHEQLAKPEKTGIIRALAAAAAEIDGNRVERLYGRVIIPFRGIMTDRLAAAIAQGQIRPDADLDALIDALIGALLYLVLAQPRIPDGRADALIDLVFLGLAPRGVAAAGAVGAVPGAASGAASGAVQGTVSGAASGRPADAVGGRR